MDASDQTSKSGSKETKAKGGMGGGLVPGTYPPPNSLRPTLVGEKWAVVAGHPLVSAVASEIFEAGGNAIDAGVAAGLASNVVQVDMCNFGGIAPILIRRASDDHAYSVAGVGRWSQSATLEAMLERHGGKLPLDGAPAIVPGAPAAWIASLERFGTMSFAEVAAPAIALAEAGFILDSRSAKSLEITGKNFAKWATSAEIYRPEGRVLTSGDRLRQPALARLLRRLVEAESSAKGNRSERLRAAHDAFYSGEVASIISDWVTSHGGYMTESDLASFEAEIEVAPSVSVGDWQFFATPSWSQGPTALEIIGILAQLWGEALTNGVRPSSEGNAARRLHEIAEAITLAFNDREDHLAAPGEMKLAIEELLSPERFKELASRISDSALAGRSGGTSAPSVMKSTTAVVTMDQAGNTFSTSPSDTLDGGPIIPDLGILCSPRGVQSRLVPHHPNRLVPGGRPVITPAAIIGLDGKEAWALACPGGDVIVQAMAQVVLHMLAYGTEPQESVEAPRIAAFNAPSAFHPHPTADRLVYLEGRFGTEVADALRNFGHQVELWPDFEFDAGSVQTIISKSNREGERSLHTGADPRRSAYAFAR